MMGVNFHVNHSMTTVLYELYIALSDIHVELNSVVTFLMPLIANFMYLYCACLIKIQHMEGLNRILFIGNRFPIGLYSMKQI